MVERPQLKASDGSMTAHSASPRATPPFPFPREKLKKGYASFRAAGLLGTRASSLGCDSAPPPTSSLPKVMTPYVEDPVSRRSRMKRRESGVRSGTKESEEELKKDYVPLSPRETSPSQTA